MEKRLLVVGFKTGTQMAVPTEMDQEMMEKIIETATIENQPLVGVIVVNKIGQPEPMWFNLNEIHFITITTESMIQAPR